VIKNSFHIKLTHENIISAIHQTMWLEWRVLKCKRMLKRPISRWDSASVPGTRMISFSSPHEMMTSEWNITPKSKRISFFFFFFNHTSTKKWNMIESYWMCISLNCTWKSGQKECIVFMKSKPEFLNQNDLIKSRNNVSPGIFATEIYDTRSREKGRNDQHDAESNIKMIDKSIKATTILCAGKLGWIYHT